MKQNFFEDEYDKDKDFFTERIEREQGVDRVLSKVDPNTFYDIPTTIIGAGPGIGKIEDHVASVASLKAFEKSVIGFHKYCREMFRLPDILFLMSLPWKAVQAKLSPRQRDLLDVYASVVFTDVTDLDRELKSCLSDSPLKIRFDRIATDDTRLSSMYINQATIGNGHRFMRTEALAEWLIDWFNVWWSIQQKTEPDNDDNQTISDDAFRLAIVIRDLIAKVKALAANDDKSNDGSDVHVLGPIGIVQQIGRSVGDIQPIRPSNILTFLRVRCTLLGKSSGLFNERFATSRVVSNNYKYLLLHYRDDDFVYYDKDGNAEYNVPVDKRQCFQRNYHYMNPLTYDYTRLYGPFTEVFGAHQNNETDVVAGMKRIVDLLVDEPRTDDDSPQPDDRAQERGEAHSELAAAPGKTVMLIGYGASGAGKTAALIGYIDENQGLVPGIVPTMLTEAHGISSVSVYVYEIGVLLRDGTCDDKASRSRECIRVPRLTKKTFEFKKDSNTWMSANENLIQVLLDAVNLRRKVRATPNNLRSSRSHVVVIMDIETSHKVTNHLIVCDLAGVENEFSVDQETRRSFLRLHDTVEGRKVRYYAGTRLEEDSDTADPTSSEDPEKIYLNDPGGTALTLDKYQELEFLQRNQIFNDLNQRFKNAPQGDAVKQLSAYRDVMDYSDDANRKDAQIYLEFYTELYSAVTGKNTSDTVLKEHVDKFANWVNEKYKGTEVVDPGDCIPVKLVVKNVPGAPPNEPFNDMLRATLRVRSLCTKYKYFGLEKYFNADVPKDGRKFLAYWDKYKDPQRKPTLRVTRHPVLYEVIKNLNVDTGKRVLTMIHPEVLKIVLADIAARNAAPGRIDDIINNRNVEGRYINDSLQELNRDISRALQYSGIGVDDGQLAYPIVPLPEAYPSRCFQLYCDAAWGTCTGATPHEESDAVAGGELQGSIFDCLESHFERKWNSVKTSLVVAMFCILNVSRDANNPPTSRYIDVDGLGREIERITVGEKNLYNKWIDFEFAGPRKKPVATISNDVLDPLIRRLGENYRGGSITIRTGALEVAGPLVCGPFIPDVAKKLFDMVERYNAAHPIGTLESIDRLAKRHLGTHVSCGFDWADRDTFSLDLRGVLQEFLEKSVVTSAVTGSHYVPKK